MPPRAFTNPAPKTESAREARKSFFCELCQKGYGRMNEFEAHEASYDHQHKKRLKDLKQMQRDPLATSKARKAERKADEKSGLITIKPVKLDSSGGTGGGFKKGGFKNAFGDVKTSTSDIPKPAGFKKSFGNAGGNGPENDTMVVDELPAPEESDTEDEGYEMYDPRFPTS